MKKFSFALSLFIVIGLLSLKDNEVCPGVAGYKALACSACHGGSISDQVFIINGKLEGDSTDGSSFEYVVRVPSGSLSVLQLYASMANEVYGAPRVSVDFTDALLEVKGSALFNAVNVLQKKAGKDANEFTIRYAFDEPLTETKTMILQGVLSNSDGTVNGDQTFYKEIVIEPKEGDLQSANLTLARDQAYYNNNQIIVSNPGKIQSIQIIDLQGKLVQSALVEGYDNVDVSSLENGVYLVVLGNNKKELQSFKFVK